MNMFAKRILVSFVSAMLVLPALSLAEDKPAGDDAQKLAEVEAAIKDLNHQLDDIKVQRSELEKQLETSEKNINDTMKHVEELKTQIQAKEKSAGELSKGKKS
jgi:septal ring factor EnvC (AmiA/AmiB activator)